MEHQLETFIESQSLFSKQDRILIAVSGGRDSMVLTHLLHACNFRIALAHVNYQLRGKDSDADAALVEAFAKHLGVPFHSTVAWEKAPEGNLQEAAREVRYQFFEALCAEHAYAFIATAHHLDDRIESLFMHLLRGTGIYGLKGIPVQRGNIVRPMLWADRTMIDAYALQHAVPYRDDTSNETDAYTRNKIRHHLIPLLKQIDADAPVKLKKSLELLSADGEALYSMAAECVKPKGEHFSVSLLAFPSSTKNTWLYHAIWPFGFNRTQCNDLLAATEGGKRIESETHIAVISKTVVDILSKTAHSLEELHVPALGKYVVGGSTLDASMTTEVPASFSGDNFHVYLDADFVNVPLTLRAAQPTDQFQPLGLEYHVNVLDYLREKGQSPSAILQTYVCVTSENRIAWLVGTQIAHWCALRSSTSSILSLSFGRHDH